MDKKKGFETTKSVKNTFGLVKTEWHQKFPFYIFCPTDTITSDTTLVGCGPLAMSQLMKFYSYPIKGLENFSNTTYDWVNMLAYDSLMTTQIQRDAVARICRDAGLAVNANYGTTVTIENLEDIPHGLAKKFNYTSQLREEATWYASLDIWIDSLKMSLARKQPIIYGGPITINSQTFNHSWIIDSYDYPNNQFNFNMGDSNLTYNDWYPMSAITTSQKAIFHTIPDHPDSALVIPYKEDFNDVIIGSSIYQIPPNIGVSHTVSF
ncbi:MAG: C10 family peptidase [Candidatus Delongbacteria bacterium]|nr:C10 family peptidase [Candidatus Delongbacteria bacterium]